MVIVVDLLGSISLWKAAITVPAEHHGDSIIIFHLEIGIFHISFATFHRSGEVRWGGVGTGRYTVLAKHHGGSPVMFHSEIDLIHISIVIFHI